MKRLVRLFAVALAMSFVVSMFYNRMVDSGGDSTGTAPPTKDVETDHRVLVVVAEVNFAPYERIIEETMVKRIKYPEKLLPRYAPLDIKDVLGKLPKEPIYAGEIVSLQRLIDKDEYKESLRQLIPPGHRALTIMVDKISGVSGFISQGDLVDLIAVYKHEVPGSGSRGRAASTQIARIIHQNVRVLIVGSRYNPIASQNPTASIKGDLGSKPITFAVTPHDAAFIHHIVQQGRASFRILLKNSEDQQILESEGYSVAELQNEVRTIVRASDPRVKNNITTKKVQHIIEVLSGRKRMPDQMFEEIVTIRK